MGHSPWAWRSTCARAKQPYNVSVAAETAACAALSNPKYLEVRSVCSSTVSDVLRHYMLCPLFALVSILSTLTSMLILWRPS